MEKLGLQIFRSPEAGISANRDLLLHEFPIYFEHALS